MSSQITLAEAAALVGLAPATLRTYAASGALRARLIGKTWVTTEAAARSFARRPRPLGRPRKETRP